MRYVQRCAITPYEGKEPYIFVSYAHKDAGQVYPIIEELARRGYRIWHDDGIVPGSEWPENIAQHLNRCYLTLAFISDNAVASDNCRREITFALSKHKEFLAVVLRPTEMSLGMELQLSAQQCIMKYNYSTEEDFLHKLCLCPGIAPCRRPDTETEPTPDVFEAPPEPAEPNAPPAVRMEVPAEEVVSQAEKSPQKRAKTKDRKKFRWVWGILAAIVCCVAVTALANMWMTVRVTPEEKVKQNETYLSLRDEYITADTVGQINKLKSLDSLNLSGCTFEAGALGLLTLPDQITTVSIVNCSGVDTLDFLTELTQMHYLTLKNSGITDAVLPEMHMENLRNLDISGNPEFTNLSLFGESENTVNLDASGTGISSLEGLPFINLSTIDFSGTAVSDISPLADISSLKSIYGGETQVREIDALAVLTGLTALDFSGCALSDMDCVFSSLRLETLDLSDNRLTDLSPFQDCTVLCHVDLAQNQFADISVLSKSAGILKTLNLSGNPLTEEQLQFLKGSPNLTELYVDGVSLETLDMLENATELTALSAVSCGLTDISGLTGSTKLSTLKLASNKITDVSPLRELSKDYLTLDLGYNLIRDVSDLPQVRYSALSILNNGDLDLSTLPAFRGNSLALSYSESILNGSAVDISDWTFYYIADCPSDKRVALENALGSYGICYLEPGETENIAKLESNGLLYIPAP